MSVLRVLAYVWNFFDDTKDILDEVYDDGNDIFEIVSYPSYNMSPFHIEICTNNTDLLFKLIIKKDENFEKGII